MGRSQYSPVRTTREGRVRVELAADHPGITDPAYRARRDELAALALAWVPGHALPLPSYLPLEHEVWRRVNRELAPLHEQWAAEEYLSGKEAVRLPLDAVPQLEDVTDRLAPLVGFRYQPVAGLAPLRDFYGSLADGVFWSTQYLRHPSQPLYTPEPDVIHEVVGHANQLGHSAVAELYRRFGAAVRQAGDEDTLRVLSRVFWFTMEFGLVWEGRHLKAFGAGILSSVGETKTFHQAEIRPADLAAMGGSTYDISRYQPVLYAWGSMEEMQDRLREYLSGFDPDGSAVDGSAVGNFALRTRSATPGHPAGGTR